MFVFTFETYENTKKKKIKNDLFRLVCQKEVLEPSPSLALPDGSVFIVSLHRPHLSISIAIACSPLPSLDWKPHEEVAKGRAEG